MPENILKIFIPAALTFFIGVAIAPAVTYFLYKYKAWKKQPRQLTSDGRQASIVHSLHASTETNTPRMGGIVIWLSAILATIVVWLLTHYLGGEALKYEFVSRNQTWLPFFTLICGSFIGLLDDIADVGGFGGYIGGGISLSKRIAIIILMGIIAGWWVYAKLGIEHLSVPYFGSIFVGWLIVPICVIVMLALYSGGIIDGVDGLSGGIMAIIYGTYTVISLAQNQIDLAAFCAVIVGATLAFLWFNIPPARFWMTETGIVGLTITITVIAFLTDSIFALPIIAFPLIATSLSSQIQLLSKKFRNGKKVFLAAPLHHHFQALGWPGYKVTMRYWVFGLVCAIVGMVIVLL